MLPVYILRFAFEYQSDLKTYKDQLCVLPSEMDPSKLGKLSDDEIV